MLHEINADFQNALSRLGRPERYFLLIDQGGTNVRLRIYPADRRWTWPQRAWNIGHMVELRRNDIRSDADLYALLAEAARALCLGTENAPEIRVVMACAGAVSAQRDSVEITNWPGQPVITLASLDVALKRAPVLMLNDVEAAAFGLVALEEFNAWPDRACELTASGLQHMSRRADAPKRRAQNKALLVPGTGIGTGSIVYASKLSGGKRSAQAEVVPSEVQHVPVSAITAQQYALIEWLRQNRTGGSPPCFEAIVSGKGLESVYEFLLQQPAAGGAPHQASPQIAAADERAAAIAQAAQSDPPDPICREALSLYYAFCGRLAQTLALAVKAFGGVYLAGDTTSHNWEFLPNSPYLQSFLTNHKQATLLKEFPLYLLDKPGINLDGALYAACRRWYLRAGTP